MNSNFYDSDSGFEDDIESPPPYDEERIPKLICFCGELTLFRLGLYSCLLNECPFALILAIKPIVRTVRILRILFKKIF